MFDRLAGTTRLVSSAAGSTTTTGDNGSSPAAISADGQCIAFGSGNSDLISGPFVNNGGLFVTAPRINTTAEVYADFGSSGLAHWSDADGWQMLTTANAEAMVVGPASELYGDFGRQGLWRWSSSAGWLQLTGANPEHLRVSGNGTLYGDLGPSGLWRWTSAAGWLRLTTVNPERMAPSPGTGNDELFASFGSSWGLWRWTSAGWQQLTPANPEDLTVGRDGRVFGDFGSLGLWTWTTTTGWLKLTNANSETLTTGAPGNLFADFGSLGLWLWNANSGWQNLDGGNAQALAAVSNGDLFADMGSAGLWHWTRAAGFVQLSPADAEGFCVATSGELFGDFGTTGVWIWTSSSGWTRLETANAENLATASNGKGHRKEKVSGSEANETANVRKQDQAEIEHRSYHWRRGTRRRLLPVAPSTFVGGFGRAGQARDFARVARPSDHAAPNHRQHYAFAPRQRRLQRNRRMPSLRIFGQLLRAPIEVKVNGAKVLWQFRPGDEGMLICETAYKGAKVFRVHPISDAEARHFGEALAQEGIFTDEPTVCLLTRVEGVPGPLDGEGRRGRRRGGA